MQKLLVKLKNVPVDAQQVHCSTSTGLNRDQSLSGQCSSEKSESSKKNERTNNNLEVDPEQVTARQNLRVSVIVLSKRGVPLMPCSFRKSKQLVKERKAKLVGTHPFRIQMLVPTGEVVDKVVLGIDVGYRWNGFSVVGSNRELVCGTLELDGKSKERLASRSKYRRNRRNKLWCRAPRFDNRSIPKGWLPPSVSRRYQSILNFIKKLCAWYPIAEIVVETASFDIQKINNPEIKGVEYQQGPLYDYQNIRSYLFSREQGHCQYCGKKFSAGNSSHIHHIIPKPKGTDKPNNLSLLHEKCHNKLHKKKDFSKLKRNKQFKAETWMSTVRNKFKEDLPGIKTTFGYITNIIRNELDLEKTHYNDAFVIAGGKNQNKVVPIKIKQKRKNNRVLQLNRKGYASSVRTQKYSIQPGDLASFVGNSRKYVVKGVHSYGTRVKVWDKEEILDFKMSKIIKCYHQKTLMWVNERDSSHP